MAILTGNMKGKDKVTQPAISCHNPGKLPKATQFLHISLLSLLVTSLALLCNLSLYKPSICMPTQAKRQDMGLSTNQQKSLHLSCARL